MFITFPDENSDARPIGIKMIPIAVNVAIT